MAKIGSLKRIMRVSVATVAMTTFSTAVGVGTVAMMSAPAYAQASLTADQAAAIQTALTNALAGVNSQGLSGSALNSALQSAIAQVESSQVAALGASAAGAVTSAVLQDAANANVPPAVVGAGLGQASVTIASAEVGTTIANEGSSSIINSFTSTASADGAPASVVASANSSPTPTASTNTGGSTTVASNSGLSSGGGGGSPGCTNPSCK